MFADDGVRLAALVPRGGQPKLHIWDAATGKELLVSTGHEGNGRCAAFSSDSRLFATADAGQVVLWDTVSTSVARRLAGHRAPPVAVAVSLVVSRRLRQGAQHVRNVLAPVVAGRPGAPELGNHPVLEAAGTGQLVEGEVPAHPGLA